MKKESFTREYYVGMWSSILSSYQWWKHDLITLLDNIKETNPIVAELFDKMYAKENDSYEHRSSSPITKFYQKLDSLIPANRGFYTKLVVKSLSKKNNGLALQEKMKLKRINYIIPIYVLWKNSSCFLCKTKKYHLTKIY